VAPLFIGFQEIGGEQDLGALAHAASARFRHDYQPLFVRGRDSATGQNVGAIFDASSGWGVYGRATRVSDLEREMSKHLVRLANAVTVMIFAWCTCGDFNEGTPVGAADSALEPLFEARPPMVDALSRLSGKNSTHADGKAYDRILVSDAIAVGRADLKLDRVEIFSTGTAAAMIGGFTPTTSPS
jgi:hypothetical protein